MSDRRGRDRDTEKREEEHRRQAETDRRGQELKEAWRQRHPQKEKGAAKRGEQLRREKKTPHVVAAGERILFGASVK